MLERLESTPIDVRTARIRNMDFKLGPREKTILRSIVHNYILTAEPVGSRTLARRYNIGLSPASIRNTMADLEEMGLLTHPHTSAGRIPTDLGYRIYVDEMMQVEELSAEVQQRIREEIQPLSAEVGFLLDRIGMLLADVSHLLSVITAPNITTGKLEKVELVRVTSDRIMVVIVVTSGLVRTINLELNSEISDADIVDAARTINRRLTGMRLIDIPANIENRLQEGPCSDNAIVRLFLELPEKIFTVDAGTQMHIDGTRHVLEQPEYKSPDKIRGIIELIEDRDVIVHLLKERPPGTTVTIGKENLKEQFSEFSVITSTYRIGDIYGSLGIIGPTRMNYSRLVSLVGFTSSLVSKRVSRRVTEVKNR